MVQSAAWGRADELFAALDGRAWRTRTAGTGTKGERLYTWARIRINRPAETGEHWLLGRRSLKDCTDLAYFICHTPENVTLIELARVAGARWAIEESFQTSKGETGLDPYQMRQYTGWYRHVTLSMFAHALLSVIRFKKGPKPKFRANGKALPARNQAPHHPNCLATATRPIPRHPPLNLATETPAPRPAKPAATPFW